MRNGYIILVLSLLAGVLFLGSCHEKEKPEETLAVSPASIDATKDLSSYKVEVKSNCEWTVAAEAENGEPVFWLTPDRSSGHDNATVTLRVNENGFRDARRAVVAFTTAGGKRETVLVTQAGDESGSATGEVSVRIGTYNLRMHNLDTDADNIWSARKERLKQSIKDCGFDVFGIQEVSTEMQAWLDKEFKDIYTFRYFSPYYQSGSGNKAQGIGYRTSAFSLSDWHFFWASDTPENMSSNDTGSSGSFSRGACCCILTHKQSGVKLFFMNTHACLNSEPNAAFAQVYIDREKIYNAAGLPSFFVGDMNARPEYKASETYRTYWKDSYDTAQKKSGASGSYNGYNSVTGKYRIDYVYHRGNGIVVKDLCISNKLYNGKYASDHFPVIVKCKVAK